MHSIGEVVKQFEVYVSSLPYPVKGKIIKDVAHNGGISYRWSISHHYKPSAGALGVYFPSALSSNSLEDAEQGFRAYAEMFVPDFEVKANDYF